MAYIDVDKLITFANNHKNKMIDANDIARFPSADVVPASEAENYRKIAEHQQSVSMRRYFEIKQLKEELAKAKQEVAREIFDDIERVILYRMILDTTLIDDRVITDIAELKKKYTEDNR